MQTAAAKQRRGGGAGTRQRRRGRGMQGGEGRQALSAAPPPPLLTKLTLLLLLLLSVFLPTLSVVSTSRAVISTAARFFFSCLCPCCHRSWLNPHQEPTPFDLKPRPRPVQQPSPASPGGASIAASRLSQSARVVRAGGGASESVVAGYFGPAVAWAERWTYITVRRAGAGDVRRRPAACR